MTDIEERGPRGGPDARGPATAGATRGAQLQLIAQACFWWAQSRPVALESPRTAGSCRVMRALAGLRRQDLLATGAALSTPFLDARSSGTMAPEQRPRELQLALGCRDQLGEPALGLGLFEVREAADGTVTDDDLGEGHEAGALHELRPAVRIL